MIDTAPPGAEAPPAETKDPIAGLRAIRQSRGGARRSTARKATPAKKATTSRAENAAKRGKYADRIVGAIKSGCAILGVRKPVHAAIIESRADSWAQALDRVAAEDKRVDAFLAKVSGFFGKGSAWGDLGGETMVTASALLIASGAVPVGPVGMAVAFMGGQALDAGLNLAARRLAERDLDANGIGEDHPDRKAWVEQLTGENVAQMQEEMRAAAASRSVPPADPDDDPTQAFPQS